MLMLKRRLRRLEREHPLHSPCRECGGWGRVVVQAEAPRPAEQPPAGCATCGAVQLVLDGTPNLMRMRMNSAEVR